MVNLIGSRRSGPPRLDPGRALTADQRAVLAARLDGVSRWWGRLPADRPVADRARTPALEPRLEEETSLAALDAALHTLAAERARLLGAGAGRVALAAAPSAAADGRLLVCELDVALGGGEAEAASRALFDAADRPPWDLWLVAAARPRPGHPADPVVCLLAWIPAEWSALAEAGIAACPSGTLYWAPSH